MQSKSNVDDYYTGDENLPDDAHVLAAYDAVTDAFEELDDTDRNKNEVIRAYQHLEHAADILENTDIVE
jgi:hypothetical protein